ncbi:hypothetical protein [Sinorhizobium psoraleae]|uniref:Uncharacterized protein n=1 Tax=Sinorhizobium psoraleae TaxID=520838 RepID=A0ABT4KBH8_9HYPH|nr:hypothetical protein [Sinorhizobium psoraleae]MCZ4088711.1 hypothetical protein [Sinorhizobium psoraleae]
MGDRRLFEGHLDRCGRRIRVWRVGRSRFGLDAGGRGDSFGAMLSNALIEIGSDALIGGLAGGTYNALQGRSFEDGFRGGLVMGAAVSAAKVTLLGVKYDPSSIKQDFHTEAAKEFARQNTHDNSYLAADVAKAGMPTASSVTFRTGDWSTI